MIEKNRKFGESHVPKHLQAICGLIKALTQLKASASFSPIYLNNWRNVVKIVTRAPSLKIQNIVRANPEFNTLLIKRILQTHPVLWIQ